MNKYTIILSIKIIHNFYLFFKEKKTPLPCKKNRATGKSVPFLNGEPVFIQLSKIKKKIKL